VHLKDVRAGGSGGYQFVELGRGRVDLPGVFKALADIRFDGWSIVELDRVPDADRTPKDCAEINRRFLTDTMKVKM
jgi:inosose dehydratase